MYQYHVSEFLGGVGCISMIWNRTAMQGSKYSPDAIVYTETSEIKIRHLSEYPF